MPSKKYAKAADSVFKNRLIRKQRGRCYYCSKVFGKKGTHAEATFEHLVPKSHGGRFNDQNIVLACRECNTNRGNNYSASEFREVCHEVNAKIREAADERLRAKKLALFMKHDTFQDYKRHGVPVPRERVKMTVVEVLPEEGT